MGRNQKNISSKKKEGAIISTRKNVARMCPADEARWFCERGEDPPKFEKRWINHAIGFGLFTRTSFDIGDFLLEYSGKLTNAHCDDSDGDYIYYFQHQGKDYIVDATDSPRYGRYVNDGIGKDANCKMKIVCTTDYVPHLCLFATRKVMEDTELRYDYGVKDLPWRKKEKGVTVTKKMEVTPTLQKGVTLMQEKGVTLTQEIEIAPQKAGVPETQNMEATLPHEKIVVPTQEMEVTPTLQKGVTLMQEKGVTLTQEIEIAPQKVGVTETQNMEATLPHEKIVVATQEMEVTPTPQKGVTLMQEKGVTLTQEIEIAPQKAGVPETQNMEATLPHEKIVVPTQEMEVTPTLQKGVTLMQEKGVTLTQEIEIAPQKVGVTETQNMEATLPHEKIVVATQEMEVTPTPQKGVTLMQEKGVTLTQEIEIAPQKAGVPETQNMEATLPHEKIVVPTQEMEVTPTLQKGVTLMQEKVVTLTQEKEVSESEEMEVTPTQQKEMNVTLAQIKDLPQENEVFEEYNDPSPILETHVEDSGDSDTSDIWPFLNASGKKSTATAQIQQSAGEQSPGENKNTAEIEDDDLFEDDDADPSYFPSSDDSDETYESEKEINVSKDGRTSSSKVSKEVASKMLTSTCVNEECVNEEEKVSIQLSQKKGGCRVYDKRQACFYCGGLFAKISDHLTNKHSSELEVSRIVAKKKGSSERKMLWYVLRNKGNFHHNLKVLNQSKGALIVNRRPTVGKEKSLYTPCPQCLGFFLKEDLWRHIQMCPVSMVSTSAPDNSKSVKYSSSLLLKSITYSGPDEELMKHVISGMKSDKVLDVIKNDSSLLLFGSNMLQKVGTGRIANVRQKIRELGRLLEELRAEHENLSSSLFTDFLKPSCFDDITNAVKNLCRKNDSNEKTERGCLKLDKPSLALKLGHSLKKLAEIKRGQALRKNDDSSRKEAEDYILLHTSEWAEKISAHAFQTLSERKFNEPDVLPLTDDIVKLRSYLLTEMKELMMQLEKSVDVTTWRTLALLTLCRVTVFNKRRGGETGQILLATYSNRRTDSDSNSEIVTSLAPIEKQLIQKLQLIEITGKRNRKVPVLLTTDMTEAIDCLIKYRDAVGVPAANKYLFAAPTTDNGYLKGWDALSMACRNCEMKKPELMKTTNLRKYVATVSQIVDLGSENELEWLANHMGHTISVHRNFYRLQEHTIELAKVSKLLIAVDRGDCSKYAGKKLDDITLDELPAVSLDADNDENDDDVNRNDSLDNLVDLDEEMCNKQGTINEVDDDVQNERIDEDFLASNYSSSDEDADIGVKKIKAKREKKEALKTNKTKLQRKPWTKEECDLLRKYFHLNVVNKKPPSRNDIMLQGRKNKKLEEIIAERGWKKVKYYTWNLAQQHHKKAGTVLSN